MLKGHIVIGAEKNRSLKFAETSYKPATLNDITDTPIGAEDRRKHMNVSLYLGSHLPEFVSETKEMFVGQQRVTNDSQVKQIKDKCRGQNITFKDPGLHNDPALHTSVAHSHFDFKGNAMEIRQVLDPEIKKDLR